MLTLRLRPSDRSLYIRRGSRILRGTQIGNMWYRCNSCVAGRSGSASQASLLHMYHDRWTSESSEDAPAARGVTPGSSGSSDSTFKGIDPLAHLGLHLSTFKSALMLPSVVILLTSISRLVLAIEMRVSGRVSLTCFPTNPASYFTNTTHNTIATRRTHARNQGLTTKVRIFPNHFKYRCICACACVLCNRKIHQ